MRREKLVVILHNIRSAHNVGSIFRTADAAGVSKVYLCGYTPTPLGDREILLRQGFGGREKISRTALGAEKYVPWEQCKQTWRLLDKLKSEGTQIVALERFDGFDKLTAGKLIASRLKIKQENVFKFKPKFPLVLVLGNEVRGLSEEVLKYCDKIIEIPMMGKKESLNVSVAAGIALFKIIEKKTPKSRSSAD